MPPDEIFSLPQKNPVYLLGGFYLPNSHKVSCTFRHELIDFDLLLLFAAARDVVRRRVRELSWKSPTGTLHHRCHFEHGTDCPS